MIHTETSTKSVKTQDGDSGRDSREEDRIPLSNWIRWRLLAEIQPEANRGKPALHKSSLARTSPTVPKGALRIAFLEPIHILSVFGVCVCV